MLRLVPLRQRDALAYVREHHRHNTPPRGSVFQVGVEKAGCLVGVAVAGRPVARLLQDGQTLEVTRCCTDGTRNACSMLYGACQRAARALGYSRLITYTLAEEPGSSLRASGWKKDADVPAQASWSRKSRERQTEKRPTGAKVRWIWELRS